MYSYHCSAASSTCMAFKMMDISRRSHFQIAAAFVVVPSFSVLITTHDYMLALLAAATVTQAQQSAWAQCMCTKHPAYIAVTNII